MAGHPPARLTWSTRKPLLLGLGSFVLLVGVIGFWSVRADIAGAVIGLGVIEVSSTQTAVQHPVGGVVKEILFEPNTSVEAGSTLLRLDAVVQTADVEASSTPMSPKARGVG